MPPGSSSATAGDREASPGPCGLRVVLSDDELRRRILKAGSGIGYARLMGVRRVDLDAELERRGLLFEIAGRLREQRRARGLMPQGRD